MCLTKVYKRKPAKEGVGWKIFLRSLERGYLKDRFMSGHRKIGPWLVAETSEYELDDEWGKYRVGFHIYQKEEHAKCASKSRHIIRKVQFRKASSCGYEYVYSNCYTYSAKAPVVVAKEVKILPLEE